MSKRTTFTTISPLPADIGRQPVLDFLHSHEGMIDLNPLVIERHPLSEPPPHCPDEERECTWWSMTDKITYSEYTKYEAFLVPWFLSSSLLSLLPICPDYT